MNHEAENQSDALRSDIDVTRQRMDNTIDSLGERLQPRHLVDEVAGWFRGQTADGDSRLNQLRDKVSRGANQAAQSVVETVKANPMPALLIGAGVAWMIYESTRDKSPRGEARDAADSPRNFDPDLYYDRPLEYPPEYGAASMPSGDGGDSKLGHLKDKASEITGELKEKASDMAGTVKEKVSELGQQTREKLSNVKDRAGEKLQAAKQRAVQLGAQVKDKAGVAYARTRERVVNTADQRPLETGLACLAAGLVAGLLLPTPSRVNRVAGPTASRLRQRARQAGTEALDKGRRVVRAAADAAKSEADAQGLTPSRLRDSAKAVAQSAGEAASDTARDEGLPTGVGQNQPREQSGGNFSGSSDPSSARPGM
jgi:ElaB/YqjD/DUF883 family membrane-anchored ribosome-binding protein